MPGENRRVLVQNKIVYKHDKKKKVTTKDITLFSFVGPVNFENAFEFFKSEGFVEGDI